jgi:hypothetical protein
MEAKRGCLVLALAALTAVACKAPLLTDAGRAVQLAKSNPPAGCQDIGPVTGKAAGGLDMGESSRVAIRNRAGEMGANYVRTETFSTDGVITGTAFKCAAAPAPPPAGSSDAGSKAESTPD